MPNLLKRLRICMVVLAAAGLCSEGIAQQVSERPACDCPVCEQKKCDPAPECPAPQPCKPSVCTGEKVDPKLDTDRDCFVGKVDAQNVINYLNSGAASRVVDSNKHLDVNGDGYISPLDPLIIINTLSDKGCTPPITPTATPTSTPTPTPITACNSTTNFSATLNGKSIAVVDGAMKSVSATAEVAGGACGGGWAMRDADGLPELKVECIQGAVKLTGITFSSSSGSATGPRCGWSYRPSVKVSWSVGGSPKISIGGITTVKSKDEAIAISKTTAKISAQVNAALASGKGWHGWETFGLQVDLPTTCTCR